MIQIRNENVYVGDHFQMKEFFTKDKNYKKESHPLDERLIDAVNYVREMTGLPIRITSTFRSEEYNRLIGGAQNSYHKKGMAVDWQFIKDSKLMVSQFKKMYFDSDSGLKRILSDLGINGVIFYEKFIHFDTRSTGYLEDKTREKTGIAVFIGVLCFLIFSRL